MSAGQTVVARGRPRIPRHSIHAVETVRKAPVAPEQGPGTRLISRSSLDDRHFLERLALFTTAFSKDRAEALLDGLSDRWRLQALAHAREVSALGSPLRQGRLAREFGERSDGARRLRGVIDEAGPELQRALFLRSPAHHRPLFSVSAELKDEPPPSVPVLLLAERLIKEALR